jgi:hypothetical protein
MRADVLPARKQTISNQDEHEEELAMNVNLRKKGMTRSTVGMSAILLLMLSILSVAQPSSAQDLAFVDGKVMDDIGNPLEGANVTVNIWNPDETQINSTLYDDATEENGFYQVIFGGMGGYEPKVNDVIQVIAKYLSEPPASNKSVVSQTETPFYSVNVTVVSVAIPEFGIGQSFGLPLAILGVVAIFVVIGRRRMK